ncbi:SRPBCC family protein [Nitrosomonas sp.]|uniref:SRPBCC family protein n=1 Tax=Nitrosomonas sp. TaxID=42353 RepID=UPI00330631DE
MRLTVQTTIQAPIFTVWEAYTTPGDIVKWNTASDDWHTTSATSDLRKGGEFCSRMEAKDGSAGFNFEGIYTNIVQGELIEYEFGGRHAQVLFSKTSDGTTVKVSFDSESSHSLEQQSQGWQAILDNFKKYVESSVDNRSNG